MKKQIGWFHLKEDTEFDNTYECAAWYERVLVKAGKYPVVVYDYREKEREDGVEVDGHIGSAYVIMDGTITSDYFGAMFCGVPVGTYDNKQNAGKESSYSMHSYLYGIADAILNKNEIYMRKGEWELFPEYEAREIKFEYDGEEHTTHGIFLKGEQ